MGHPHLHLLLRHQPCCEALDSDPFRLGLRAFSAAQGDCISIRHSYMAEPKKIENFRLTENQKIFHKLLVPTSKKQKTSWFIAQCFKWISTRGKRISGKQRFQETRVIAWTHETPFQDANPVQVYEQK